MPLIVEKRIPSHPPNHWNVNSMRKGILLSVESLAPITISGTQ